MLELAVAFPLLCLLLFGAIDFGRVFFAGLRVASAARAGAQYGSISRTHSADLEGMRQAALRDGADLAGLAATAVQECRCPDGAAIGCHSGACTSGFKGIYVQVTATAQFRTVVDYPGIPSRVPLASRASMRVR
jgi:Flp pilus assembly protein TadG